MGKDGLPLSNPSSDGRRIQAVILGGFPHPFGGVELLSLRTWDG